MQNDHETEHYYRERSRALFKAAEGETDPGLRMVLYARSEDMGHRALSIQLQRRAQLLLAMGVSPVA